MPLVLEHYTEQTKVWPEEGKVILAQHDEATIVVYQAFHADTARYAVEHQQVGGARYSFSRMSWIKPNFLWMMYRCGWMTKDEDQGRVLALRTRRSFFDGLLENAVASSWRASNTKSQQEWKASVAASDVRLQWDPDHAPDGSKLPRRAVQLGLRGDTLRRFVEEAVVEIEDISELVIQQREFRDELERLETPRERVYEVTSLRTRQALGL